MDHCKHTYNLKKEVLLTVSILFFLIFFITHTAKFFNLEDFVLTAVGIFFIALPVLILDNRAKPYKRYGIAGSGIIKAIPTIAVLSILTFLPIILFVFSFPEIWNVGDKKWIFSLSSEYSPVIFSHFFLVALPEEFFFRGYLQGRLDDIFPSRYKLLQVKLGLGTLLQALIFALAHFIVDFQPYRLLVFFPGLIFGWLKNKFGSIAPVVIYHALCNIFMDLFRAGFGL